MEKEELILRNKFLDLARNAYFKNIVTHSTFLNLYEQTIFEMIQNELPNVKSIMFGGYSEAERLSAFIVMKSQSLICLSI